MKNKRKIVSLAVHAFLSCGITEPALKKKIVIINFHRVRSGPDCSCPFDDEVFGPTASEFRRILVWLSRRAKILSEEQLLGYLDSGSIPSGLKAMITFDDGYADQHRVAFPILRELGIPAVFFIPTDFINRRRLGWWDHVAYIVKNSSADSLVFEGRRFRLPEERREAIRLIQTSLQYLAPREIADTIHALSNRCRAAVPGADVQGRELMTWEQIRELSDSGMAIGSHTHTHPILSEIDPLPQEDEMLRSKRTIGRRIGKAPLLISYPVGGYRHISRQTVVAAERTGYRAGFTFNTGINTAGSLERFTMRRIAGNSDITMFTSSLLFPEFFTWSRKAPSDTGSPYAVTIRQLRSSLSRSRP
jgi:peptidoglycan/xylan/chitin deacetylase (PgdA/CDA1 family)